MDAPRTQRFLIVETDARYAAWIQHAIGAGFPNDSIVIMDWTSFGRVRTAMTVRDYDIVLLGMAFDEGIEEPTTDSLDWIRKLRSQPGFPEMIILAEGGSELAAVRTLRLGAADYLPKRLLTPARLHRSLKLTLRAIEKEMARRAARPVPPKPETAETKPTEAPKNEMSRPAISAVSTQTGATLARAAALAVKHATTTPAATQTGTNLAAAAKAALATPPAHVATHTGASLAQAARAALAPTKLEPVRVDATPQDPAATSQPAAAMPVAPIAAARAPAVVSAPMPLSETASPSASQPVQQFKDSKQVAPPHHQIPGYTLLQRIGESEAAAVYLAIAEDLGHNVALKVSKRRHTGDANETGQRSIMFQREFEAIAALDHPSIIDLYDYGIHEGVEYLAMEYFPCGDLKARLQNPLTADEAIAFLKEIARSLKVVHEAGIIHRDLKPPNVMLRDDGSVVLIDFGLARSLLSGDSSTRTGVLRGSPYYMSPEQAQGETLDPRTDLYSLGVILYEMLAGKKPYLGASAIDVLQQHVMAPVPELPVHHLFYQPLLERLMSKSREQRLSSCDELLSALEQMAHAMSDSGIIDPETLVSAGASS
jgi:DNA-binding NarL/FixJ family response regulator